MPSPLGVSSYELIESEDGRATDPRDPLFESDDDDDDDSYYEVCDPKKRPPFRHSKSNFSVGYAFMPTTPELTLSEFADAIRSTIEEFARSNNPAATVEELKEMNCSLYMDLFVVDAIKYALDQPDNIQGNFASLITLLHDAHVLSTPQLLRAFEKLIQAANDLKIDVPNVFNQLYLYFVVAVEDRLINIDFLKRLPETFIRSLSQEILDADPALLRQAEELRIYKNLLSEIVADLFASSKLEEVRDFLESSERLLNERVAKELGPFRPASGIDGRAPSPPPLVVSSDGQSERVLSTSISETATLTHLMKHEFVRKFLTAALSQPSDLQREFASKALNAFYGDATSEVIVGVPLLSGDDVQLGFTRLIDEVEDIALDVPCAFEMMSKFVCRAVVDEVLPPAFVKDFLRLHLGGRGGIDILRRARRWLSGAGGHPHVLAERFAKVWTATDDLMSDTLKFKHKLREIIFSYFDTGALELCVLRLSRLEMTPNQNDEAARKIVEYAMERKSRVWPGAMRLLAELSTDGQFDPDTVLRGFNQLVKKIDDLKKDVPECGNYLNTFFVPEAKALNLLPPEFDVEKIS